MDQELIAYLDRRFGENALQIQGIRDEVQDFRGEFEGFREDTSQRFERVDEAIRQTRVLIEGTRDEIRLVAEAVVGNNEGLEAFRKEVDQGFDDMGKLIRPVYSALDQRVRNLEVYIDLQSNDPIKIIKERILGRPPE